MVGCFMVKAQWVRKKQSTYCAASATYVVPAACDDEAEEVVKALHTEENDSFHWIVKAIPITKITQVSAWEA